jgi:hypothetical protein
MYMVKATFFKGTNVLDDIETCGELFLLHHSEPPFREDTVLLNYKINATIRIRPASSIYRITEFFVGQCNDLLKLVYG